MVVGDDCDVCFVEMFLCVVLDCVYVFDCLLVMYVDVEVYVCVGFVGLFFWVVVVGVVFVF